MESFLKHPFFLLVVLAFFLLIYLSFDGLEFAVELWGRDEYSHGYLIPFVAAFLIYKSLTNLKSPDIKGSWVGFAIGCVGILMVVLGELGAVYTVILKSHIE